MSHNPSHPHAPLAPAGPRRTELHCGPHVQWGPQANRPADDTIPLAPAPRAHIVLSVSPFYYPRLCKRDPRGRPPPTPNLAHNAPLAMCGCPMRQLVRPRVWAELQSCFLLAWQCSAGPAHHNSCLCHSRVHPPLFMAEIKRPKILNITLRELQAPEPYF